jgi:hypothetical protein
VSDFKRDMCPSFPVKFKILRNLKDVLGLQSAAPLLALSRVAISAANPEHERNIPL